MINNAIPSILLAAGLFWVYPCIRLFARYARTKVSKKVEFSVCIYKAEDPGNNYYYCVLVTPFYDEKKHFYLGLSFPLKTGFTPIETMPMALSEIYRDKSLFQVRWDSIVPPQLPELISDLKANNALVYDGAFVYPPGSFAGGGLDCAITDGMDAFFVLGTGISSDVVGLYNSKRAEYGDKLSAEFIIEIRKLLGSDGELVKWQDQWQIINTDIAFIRQAINIICTKIAQKAVKKAGSNKVFTGVPDIAAHIEASKYMEFEHITVFADDDRVVFSSRKFREEIELT